MTWSNLSSTSHKGSPPSPRHFPGFSSVNNKLFVVGGVYLGDFYQIDADELEWQELNTSGVSPNAALQHFGLVTVSKRLLIFGGYNKIHGNRVNEIYGIDVPKITFWRSDSGPGFLVDTYDWDIVRLNSTSSNFLKWRLILCSGMLPCSLLLKGDGLERSVIHNSVGSLACLALYGCSSLILEAFTFQCNGRVGANSVVESSASTLKIINVSFVFCSAAEDGGSVSARLLSNVTIEDSRFFSSHSDGFGGAVGVASGNLILSNTRFENCSSLLGGGAVSASSEDSTIFIHGSRFLGCSTLADGGSILLFGGARIQVAATLVLDSRSEGFGGGISAVGGNLQVDNSILDNCSSGSGGGGLSAIDFQSYGSRTSIMTVVIIQNSSIFRCKTQRFGGCVYLASMLTVAHISGTLLKACECTNGGGGLAMHDHVFLSVEESNFEWNSAELNGGGGIYVDNAYIHLNAVNFLGNSALSGDRKSVV